MHPDDLAFLEQMEQETMLPVDATAMQRLHRMISYTNDPVLLERIEDAADRIAGQMLADMERLLGDLDISLDDWVAAERGDDPTIPTALTSQTNDE